MNTYEKKLMLDDLLMIEDSMDDLWIREGLIPSPLDTENDFDRNGDSHLFEMLNNDEDDGWEVI